jgi:hypothetical protein
MKPAGELRPLARHVHEKRPTRTTRLR